MLARVPGQRRWSRAAATNDWNVPASKDVVHERLLAFREKVGGRLRSESEGSLVWTQGSVLKIRPFGTWNVDPAVLPVEMRVAWDGRDGTTDIHAELVEAASHHAFDARTEKIHDAHLRDCLDRLEAACVSDESTAPVEWKPTLTPAGEKAGDDGLCRYRCRGPVSTTPLSVPGAARRRCIRPIAPVRRRRDGSR